MFPIFFNVDDENEVDERREVDVSVKFNKTKVNNSNSFHLNKIRCYGIRESG